MIEVKTGSNCEIDQWKTMNDVTAMVCHRCLKRPKPSEWYTLRFTWIITHANELRFYQFRIAQLNRLNWDYIDVGDDFDHFRYQHPLTLRTSVWHQHFKHVTIVILSLTLKNCHRHLSFTLFLPWTKFWIAPTWTVQGLKWTLVISYWENKPNDRSVSQRFWT